MNEASQDVSATEARQAPASTPAPPAKPAAEAPQRHQERTVPAHGTQHVSRRRRRLRRILLPLGPLAVLIGAGYLYIHGGRYASTDDAYVGADHVLVAPQVGATITEVDVKENQHVDKGAVLFRLDDSAFRIAEASAEAALAQARSNVEALKSSYAEAEQQLALAKQTAAYEEDQYARQAKLAKSGVVSAAALDTATHARDTAERQVGVLRQQIAQITARLGGDPNLPTDQHPTVRAALAALDKAKLDLSHTVVTAPFDGAVSNVPDAGQLAQAGQPALALVGDRTMWVDANLKETDLTKVRKGQPATVEIDTYPGQTWHGTVESISQATGSVLSVLPAQNASGNWVKVVQRLAVRVAIKNDHTSAPLRAGMSAWVRIDTGHTRNMPFGLNWLARLLGANPAPEAGHS